MNSVTEILDSYTEPFLIEWKIKMGKAKAKAISDEALRVGTMVDQFVRQDIKGDGYAIPNGEKAVESCMMGWEAFKLKYPNYISEVEDIQVELTKDGIVGHPDIVHKLEIADIKSGNQLVLRPKYCVQASKYALMKGKDRASILLLSKTNGNGVFLYIWWDKELIEYFGGKVFDAFQTIYEYGDTVNQMVLNYMETEALGVS